jgi:hypothetical protein
MTAGVRKIENLQRSAESYKQLEISHERGKISDMNSQQGHGNENYLEQPKGIGNLHHELVHAPEIRLKFCLLQSAR